MKEQINGTLKNRDCKYYHPNNKCGLKAWCMLNAKKCNVNADYCQLKLRTQLARKTQECEQKDKQIKEWNEYTNLVRSWIIQAAKDLGLDTEHSFGVEHFTFAVRCLKEENKKLKQECEEKQKIIEELKKEAKRISANYIKDVTRYRKALEEIEELQETIFDIINKAKSDEAE